MAHCASIAGLSTVRERQGQPEPVAATFSHKHPDIHQQVSAVRNDPGTLFHKQTRSGTLSQIDASIKYTFVVGAGIVVLQYVYMLGAMFSVMNQTSKV